MKYKKCNIIDIHIHDGQYTINILSTVVYFYKIVSHCGICNELLQICLDLYLSYCSLKTFPSKQGNVVNIYKIMNKCYS